MDDANHDVAFTCKHSFDSVIAESASEDAVGGGGWSSALEVSEDTYTDGPVGMVLELFFDGEGVAGFVSFGDDDDAAAFSSFFSCCEFFDKKWYVGGCFGDEDVFCSSGDAGVECEVS